MSETKSEMKSSLKESLHVDAGAAAAAAAPGAGGVLSPLSGEVQATPTPDSEKRELFKHSYPKNKIKVS
jgi:hypothetical protein